MVLVAVLHVGAQEDEMMTTIRQIAKEAGVSVATVSYVLNGTKPVTPEVERRVRLSIERHQYTPSDVARSLRRRTTSTVALVFGDIMNSFHVRLAKGVEDACARQGYGVLLYNHDEDEHKELQCLTSARQRRVDGLLLVPTGCNLRYLRTLQKQGVALVQVDRHCEGLDSDVVEVDDEAAMYGLVTRLRRAGYQRIGLVALPQTTSTGRNRLLGYRRALEDDDARARVVIGGFTKESGYESTAAILADDTCRPDALVYSSGRQALGGLQWLKAHGMDVPKALAVATYDDEDVFPILSPAVTAVENRAYDVGQQAIELLTWRLQTRRTGERRRILLDAPIVVRESTPGMSSEV